VRKIKVGLELYDYSPDAKWPKYVISEYDFCCLIDVAQAADDCLKGKAVPNDPGGLWDSVTELNWRVKQT
jgi:hypothetical protein